MKLNRIPLIALAGFLLAGCHSTAHLDAVSGFEVERYLGTWYEAARFPHPFEKGLTSVTADYSRNHDGTIKVINRGFSMDKRAWKQATAVAKFKKGPDIGWLKVSFFRPFYADYKILYLDEAYTQAIVTGPSYRYLWILVRDPATPKSIIDRLIRQSADFGFDTNRIERIDQSMHGDENPYSVLSEGVAELAVR